MIHGNITKSARPTEDEIERAARWCPNCNKVQLPTVEDNSFDDHFGRVTEWAVTDECSMCHETLSQFHSTPDPVEIWELYEDECRKVSLLMQLIHTARVALAHWLDDMDDYTEKQYGKGDVRRVWESLLTTPPK